MRAALLFLVLTTLVVYPVAAQTVRGVVVEEGSGLPVDGAMVVLFDAQGTPVRRFLTDGLGRFTLATEGPGDHVVRVDRIGYASRSTGIFYVGPEGAERTIEVPVHAIELAGFEVESSRRCEVRPEEGRLTARIWEEARKALEAAAWTLSSGVYRYTLLHYARELDPEGHRVLDEEREFYRGRSQAPYVSLPADQLMKEGFVHTLEDGRQSYFAPDAEVLLSDPFLDTHCMRLANSRDGLVGLKLEPVSGRRLPEIEGTLWLDAHTARLEKLEFRYVNLRGSPRVNGELGGEVVFGGLPNGAWVVKEWRIRMPLVGQRGPDGPLFRMGYRDEGGVVWRVIDRDGTIVLEATTATVMGFVTDSLGLGAVSDVKVVARTGEWAVSGDDGSFLLSGLAEGWHELNLYHASLDTLGLLSPPAVVEAELGGVIQARVSLPSPAQLVIDACGGTPRPPATGVVFGRLVDPSGASVGRRFVQLTPMPSRTEDYMLPHRAAPDHPDYPTPAWRSAQEGEQPTLATETDDRGIFLLCDIPLPARVGIRSWGPGAPESLETLTLRASDTVTFTTLVEQGGDR